MFYTTSWNDITRLPSGDSAWTPEDEARRLYEKKAGLTIVDASKCDADGAPFPRWVLGFGASRRVRAQFFDEHMTLVHMVDWNWIDGRLWRWLTYDWTYPNTTQHWEQNESVARALSGIEPDGTGYIELLHKQPRRELDIEFTDRAQDSYWVDYPEFGDWAALADPGPTALEVAGDAAPANFAV
ncbi:hypothetical protein [Myceligenerans halotolerans]